MINNYTVATVFGGTGFIGRQVVRELAARGVLVKVATRAPERAYFLKPSGRVGQIVPVACRYDSIESIAQAVRGADLVVNCVGILFERGKRRTFRKVHVDFPAMIARVCSEEGVLRLVHLSSLGCDRGESLYAKSKLEGERAVFANFANATILRPSVVFGSEDRFFNLFAKLSRYLPFLPLIGGGQTKLQPVYVGDVAAAVVGCLFASGEPPNGIVEGKIYELGGPQVLSLQEVYEKVFFYTGRRRPLVSIPWGLAKVQGWFMSLLPNPLMTPDQVETLKSDNVVSDTAKGFAALGLMPRSMDSVLPGYLEGYRAGGRVTAVRN